MQKHQKPNATLRAEVSPATRAGYGAALYVKSPLLQSALAARGMPGRPSQHTACTSSKGFFLLYKAQFEAARWIF